MSIQAISYVLQESPTKLWDRLVLISLANHANDIYESFPAVQTICHESGTKRRTVQRSLRRLVESGEILEVINSRYKHLRVATYFLAGFAKKEGFVGPPTPVHHTVSQRFSSKTIGSPQHKGIQNAEKGVPLTPSGRQGSHPYEGQNLSKGAQDGHPQGAKSDALKSHRRHPRASGSAGKGAKGDALTVSNRQLNPGAKNPEPAARPQSGRSGSSGGGENHDRPPDTAWREGLDQPADPATLREIADHMKAVIEGKAMPTFVGPDYHAEETDESKKE